MINVKVLSSIYLVIILQSLAVEAKTVSFPIETLKKAPTPDTFEQDCVLSDKPTPLNCQYKAQYYRNELSSQMIKLQVFKDQETQNLFENTLVLHDDNLKNIALTYLKKVKLQKDSSFLQKVVEQIFTDNGFFAKTMAEIFNNSNDPEYVQLARQFNDGHPDSFYNVNFSSNFTENYEDQNSNLGMAFVAQKNTDNIVSLLDQKLPNQYRFFWNDYYNYATSNAIAKASWTTLGLEDIKKLCSQIPEFEIIRSKAAINAEFEPANKELERLSKLIQEGHYENLDALNRQMLIVNKLSHENMMWAYVPINLQQDDQVAYLIVKVDSASKNLVQGIAILNHTLSSLKGTILVDFLPPQYDYVNYFKRF